MKRTVSLVVAALLLASGVISTANAYVAVSVGVGDRPYYVHGPAYYVGPARYVWIPGHVTWRHHHRVWVHGYYAAR